MVALVCVAGEGVLAFLLCTAGVGEGRVLGVGWGTLCEWYLAVVFRLLLLAHTGDTRDRVAGPIITVGAFRKLRHSGTALRLMGRALIHLPTRSRASMRWQRTL